MFAYDNIKNILNILDDPLTKGGVRIQLFSHFLDKLLQRPIDNHQKRFRIKSTDIFFSEQDNMLRKVLRNAGLALVLLPEPFTTPLGLALLGTAYLMGRFNRIDTPAYLRGFIKLYLNETRPSGSTGNLIHHKLLQKLNESDWRYEPKKDVRCGIDSSRLMLRFGKDMAVEFDEPRSPIRHRMKDRWAGYVWPGSAPDLNVTPTATHIINTSSLSLRLLEDACGGSRRPIEKTVRHSLNREMLGALSAENAPAGRTISHTMGTARLSTVYTASRGTRAIDKAIYHSMNLSGYVLPCVTVAENAAVHAVDSTRLLQHYNKTMPSRLNAPKKNISHSFNPAKASLALGIG